MRRDDRARWQDVTWARCVFTRWVFAKHEEADRPVREGVRTLGMLTQVKRAEWLRSRRLRPLHVTPRAERLARAPSQVLDL